MLCVWPFVDEERQRSHYSSLIARDTVLVSAAADLFDYLNIGDCGSTFDDSEHEVAKIMSSQQNCRREVHEKRECSYYSASSWNGPELMPKCQTTSALLSTS